MKIFLLLSLLILSLHASHSDANTTEVSSDDTDIIVVKDNSGLSDDAIRERAKESDAKAEMRVNITDVTNSLDEDGKVNLSKLQERWEDLSPTPVRYDWVKTKSGEWFKGEIEALYDNKLEFDSDEIGSYTFDFDDVVEIKSYQVISVNIENLATFPGILRLRGDKLTIIQGNHSYDFEKKDIVSFAPDGENERNFWTAKVSIGLDIRSGNTKQYDFSSKINLKRRTSSSRLTFDYLGRITAKDSVETANDHRLSQKYDRYITKNFFWTPLFSEIYTDKYKNIDKQVTLGLGIGYTIFRTKKLEWSISGGPALLYTKYETVAENVNIDDYSPAFEMSTKLEYEVSSVTDLTYDYKLTLTNKNSGKYKHHMLVTLENELTSWLDIDITGVWDFILEPEKAKDGSTPDRSDFQLLVGLGVEF